MRFVFLLTLVALLLSFEVKSEPVSSSKAAHGCLKTHIREALALNKKRREIYSNFTDGRSREVSNQLIWNERLALLFAGHYDRAATLFQKAGIGFLCDEFVPIVERSLVLPSVPLQEDFVLSLDRKSIRNQIRNLIDKRDWEGLERYTNDLINNIQDQKHYFCMTRHLLESIRRSAGLARHHLEKAKVLWGANSDEVDRLQNLISSFNKNQNLGFLLAFEIDVKAAPLQKAGVAILCNELPDIPPANPL